MGLKLPEMPFCVGFAARAAGAGRQLEASGGAAGRRRHRRRAGLCALQRPLDAVHVGISPAIRCFPISTNIGTRRWRWPRPIATCASCPPISGASCSFPILFSLDWHVADDLGFQDIRVCVAYLAGDRGACCVWLVAARKPRSAGRQARHRAAVRLCGARYFVWLRIFAIYRYIVLLEMLAPLLIVAAVGLLPLPRRERAIWSLGGLSPAAILVTPRSDFLERAPVDDPYIQAALPPIPRPDHTMVLMTGDAPMGFIATPLPPQIPVLRIDGWMVQPRDGTVITRDMMRRVKAQLADGGDLYLIADAGDMAPRARRPGRLSTSPSAGRNASNSTPI